MPFTRPRTPIRFSRVIFSYLTLTMLSAPGSVHASTPILASDLPARVIAVGIPGAGAVAEVGPFLTGGPMHDRTTSFALFTKPGQVLDPKRVLVASTSNFGAPLARADDPEGAMLSIDPSANGLDLSTTPQFASGGEQASVFNGRVQLYTAQSPAFVNSIKNPNAVTASLPGVSLPTGISINNGNGRPWFANAPNGARGDGTVSVIDPQGYPLEGPPDPIAGGVFAGNLTNRVSDSTGGMTSATLGTAIMTKSSDLSGRAVFAAVMADGSVVQIHVQKGIDGLVPPGTLTPLAALTRDSAESTDPQTVARAGVVFNWVPTRNLFIADPQANRLVVLDISDDGTLFHASARQITLPQFNVPIDLAPTTREIAAGSFASNTTLGGGSDLYVLNRGDNSIVRMGIDGSVQAVRTIQVALPAFRANGIAVSSDGQTIYVTGTTADHGGALLALPAFGGSAVVAQFIAQAEAANQRDNLDDLSRFVFALAVTPEQGLGPLFNQPSCVGCHSSPAAGGAGTGPDQAEQLVGKLLPNGTFATLDGQGGPTARAHSIAELGIPCGIPTGPAASANVVSLRTAMSLRGDGLIDDIAQGDILANMTNQAPAIRGRANVLSDGRIGKFGWKANVPTLVEFMGDAYRNEMGLTNPLQPSDEISGCAATLNSPELDALALQAVAMFLNNIDPPPPSPACIASTGASLFSSTGCAGCHTPVLPGPGARGPVHLYSDLLLHDMGPTLADQMQQASAQGNEWRTMPLWRVAERSAFLHDGRAHTLGEAIAAHAGQAQGARDAFAGLSDVDKQALIDFLGCI